MTVDRWKCTSYCLCRPESRGHFEKASDDGVWVLHADHEAENNRLRSALFRYACHCGRISEDPAVHAEFCPYRVACSGVPQSPVT